MKQTKNGTDTSKCSDLPGKYSPDWIAKLDGRTSMAKAVQDRLQDLENNLGGRDAVSYQEHSLCKRIVWLEVLIESREAALARGEEINEGVHTQSINALAGLLAKIGLNRRAADVPDLASYLARKEREKEAAQ